MNAQYGVVDGRLTQQPVTMSEVPAWDPTGSGPHSVTAHVDFCKALIADGGVLLGAFGDGDGDGGDEERFAGLAVVNTSFEPGLAWLSFLHVSRPHRRRGAARALWSAAVDLALGAGASAIYVSATPTGSAVGFYLAPGCRLADPVHPALFAEEPDDIHLVRQLP